MMMRALIISGLLVVNLASAVAVVQIKHQNRMQRGHLQQTRLELDSLKLAWAQLRLEESTLTNYDHLKHRAQKQLGMRMPEEYTVLEARR